jgi:hypothetical protein
MSKEQNYKQDAKIWLKIYRLCGTLPAKDKNTWIYCMIFFHLWCSMSHSWFSYRSTIRAWIQKWAFSGSIKIIMLLILAHCTPSCNHRLWASRRGFYLWSPACFFASASPFMQRWAHGKWFKYPGLLGRRTKNAILLSG